jgi:hypothetical protein
MQIAFAPVALNVSQRYVKLLRPLHSVQFARAFAHISIELISITADNFYIYHQGLNFLYINLFIDNNCHSDMCQPGGSQNNLVYMRNISKHSSVISYICRNFSAVYIYSFILSFSILSDDRSKTSSKTISPHRAI